MVSNERMMCTWGATKRRNYSHHPLLGKQAGVKKTSLTVGENHFGRFRLRRDQ